MGAHKNLIVWQKSIDLVKQVYQISLSFPKDETFGLVSQIKRAVVSIPSNIAEGFGRGTKKECKHFVHISLGSAAELETQLIISRELDFISNNDDFESVLQLLDEIIKMLRSLIRSLKKQALVNS